MAVVILDSDQIPEGISTKFVRFPGEGQEQFYHRVTHLHHQSQRIYQIGDLSAVKNLVRGIHRYTESHIFQILLKVCSSCIVQIWKILLFLDTLSPFWSLALLTPTI